MSTYARGDASTERGDYSELLVFGPRAQRIRSRFDKPFGLELMAERLKA